MSMYEVRMVPLFSPNLSSPSLMPSRNESPWRAMAQSNSSGSVVETVATEKPGGRLGERQYGGIERGTKCEEAGIQSIFQGCDGRNRLWDGGNGIWAKRGGEIKD